MNVRYLTQDEFAKWDHFVLNHQEGHRFQTTEWLRLIMDAEPYVIIFEDNNGQWLGGFAYTINRKAGLKRLLRPPLTPYHFPIGMNRYQEELKEKDTVLSQLYRQMAVVQLTPSPLQMKNQSHVEISQLLPSTTRSIIHPHPTNVFFSKDHPDPDDEYLLQHYKRDCRKKIRRGRRQGLSITTSIDPKEAYSLFEIVMNQKGREVPITLSQFERLHARLQPDGDLLQGVVDREGKLHTALWIVYDNKAGYLLLSGINKSTAHRDAGRLLRHEGIKSVLQSGRDFDFEGSSIPTVAFLHQSFNPKRIELETLKFINNRVMAWSNPIIKRLTGKSLF